MIKLRSFGTITNDGKAEYGKEIVYALSGQLVSEFGRGFGRANLFHMLRFSEVFPGPKMARLSLETNEEEKSIRR